MKTRDTDLMVEASISCPATVLAPRPFPATSTIPTLRQRHEGWGTRSFVAGNEGYGLVAAAQAVPMSDKLKSPKIMKMEDADHRAGRVHHHQRGDLVFFHHAE